ncbi:MAG: (d)CMP kinase [Flavobacteriaceae bacterium]|nr:(d)CMP kinase [Flavobacteriaceae bacterium]
MNNKITIAVDGFSSTGKSTVAKQLAKELGYVYVDTGAMYRAVALFAMRNSLITDSSFNKEGLIAQLPEINLKFVFDDKLGFAAIFLNGENVEAEIRTMEVSQYVSKVAAISEVREKLVSLQKMMGREKGVVMDGRDIGTVVFPNAELKIFMTASAEKRAKRRYLELQGNNQKVSYEEVLKNVEERDHLDTTRKDSPLVKAEDALEVDNSEMGIDEQFEKIYRLAQAAIDSVNSSK